MKSITLQTYNNGVTEPLWDLQLILRNLFLSEPIFKIVSLNLFSPETTFRYREILKFLGLRS